ncbi:hypothetical protein ACFROC_00500 [Nocardia tengchongensis]|uniref:hypothetical protein n=1 Tax=Nocardia tengchongensis TaxID=2055889 RepID=UPI00368FF847
MCGDHVAGARGPCGDLDASGVDDAGHRRCQRFGGGRVVLAVVAGNRCGIVRYGPRTGAGVLEGDDACLRLVDDVEDPVAGVAGQAREFVEQVCGAVEGSGQRVEASPLGA